MAAVVLLTACRSSLRRRLRHHCEVSVVAFHVLAICCCSVFVRIYWCCGQHDPCRAPSRHLTSTSCFWCRSQRLRTPPFGSFGSPHFLHIRRVSCCCRHAIAVPKPTHVYCQLVVQTGATIAPAANSHCLVFDK
ncbi:hypothetical protein IWX49DRAFT_617004 [Phyllosticta citricarpa]